MRRYQDAGSDLDKAQEKLRTFFGWSKKSEMPRLYAKAYFETTLAEVWDEKFDHFLDALRRSAPENPQSIAAVLKYYDDFAAENRSIRDLSDTDQIVLVLDGRTRSLSFNKFGAATQVMKHVFADWIDQHDANYVIVSFGSIASYVSRRGINSLIELIVSEPFDARSHWNTFVLAGVTPGESYGLRALLHSLCRLNIGHWTPQVRSIIRALKSPKVDKYRVVRVGDCVLPHISSKPDR